MTAIPIEPRMLLRREDEGDVRVLVVVGEVDFGTSPMLREALEPVRGKAVLDLCETTFMDSSGMQILLRATADPDGRLHVACPPVGPVRQLFAVAGVGEWLNVYETRSDALAAF